MGFIEVRFSTSIRSIHGPSDLCSGCLSSEHGTIYKQMMQTHKWMMYVHEGRREGHPTGHDLRKGLHKG